MPVIKLTGSGNWTVPEGVTSVRLLVVAGGGGGGSNQGGGGGAGGVIYDPAYSVTPAAEIAYSVGNGGNGGPFSSRGNGTNGQNTVFGDQTAIGGGFGSGSTGVAGGDGGSGGGGDGAVAAYPAGGAGTVGQGNQGGSKAVGTPGEGEGFPGGGGAGSGGGRYGNTAAQIARAAENGASPNTIGGDGVYYGDIYGETEGDGGWFASGGSGLDALALPGGGGEGGATSPVSQNGVAGLAETGGGGGAGHPTNRAGGAGGSGVILIQYGELPLRTFNITADQTIVLDVETEVEYLLVGGGGGAESNFGGGGGGGQVVTGTVTLPAGSYPAVIGAGGLGRDQATGLPIPTNGGATTFAGITALGGGHGGASGDTERGGDGATGGGAGWQSKVGSGGGGGTGSAGGDGGNAWELNTTSDQAGGGGGGAGGDGQDGAFKAAGDGGIGITSTILDGSTPIGYGGGGGAGGYTPFSMTAGAGVDGGGNGTDVNDGSGDDGVDGLGGGGGGGGGGGSGGKGGDGGSGAVILVELSRVQPELPYQGLTFLPQPSPQPDPPALVTDIATTASIEGEQSITLRPFFSGTEPLGYRWRRDGAVIREALTPDFTILGSPANNGSTYQCEAYNEAGSALTSILTLTVTVPAFAFKLDLPATLTFSQYTIATLRVDASTPRGTAYQWYRVGEGLMNGATSPTLDVYVDPSIQGFQFYCIATDSYSQTAQSTTATITVVGTSLNDTTEPQAQPDAGRLPPTAYRKLDWASVVAAAEGPEAHYVEDYEFSGRSFYRLDQLLNPKDE